MKILITGKSGYIATSLYNSFKNAYNVTAVGRDDFNLSNSKETYDYFKDKYFDVVIHCAVAGGSRLQKDNVDVLDVNLKMYYNLLEQRNHYDKFIHFGSGAQFRSNPGPYGISKSIIADSMINKERFYNIIIYGVFDENELDTRFIKANLKRYINKEPMMVDTDIYMSFFYMKDLILLVNYIVTKNPSELVPLNHASYVGDLHLKEIANFINTLDNYKVPIYVSDQMSEDYVSRFNAGYDLKYLGLRFGIQQTFSKLKK
jgi:nucleoside-diphosphate-sugar epimerase